MKFETLSLHTGTELDPTTGAASLPIVSASTFHQTMFGDTPKFDYARSGNPTREALETAIAQLEGGHRGFAFASGMAAITAVLLTLPTGSHIVAGEDIYGGAYRALTTVFARLGIETTFVDGTSLEAIEAAVRPNTRLLYLETPSNPTLKIVDLRGAVTIAQRHGVQTAVDNTFMSPFLQRPHGLGVDYVIHSATKFLGGHSDVISGLVTVKDSSLADAIYAIQNGFGAVPGPHDCWLVHRGLKTLAVRMLRSQETARFIAERLAAHPAVKRVFYPALAGHEGSAVHAAQSDGPGAVLSFELAGQTAVGHFVNAVELPLYAVSLGAVESILSYPAHMSHAAMPPHERARRGISDGLLRLSVGLEDKDDLWQDLAQALETASK